MGLYAKTDDFYLCNDCRESGWRRCDLLTFDCSCDFPATDLGLFCCQGPRGVYTHAVPELQRQGWAVLQLIWPSWAAGFDREQLIRFAVLAARDAARWVINMQGANSCLTASLLHSSLVMVTPLYHDYM